jgi:GWxTD domain-containing protein
MHLGELGDGWSFGRAADDFGRATELEPGWSYAWLLRGMAQRAEGDWQAGDPRNLGKRVGFGSIEDAVQSFAKAMETDPGNVAAGRALFEGVQALRDTARFAQLVLPALRRAAAGGTKDTSLFLALGRTERLVGDAGAAVEACRRYLELGGTRGLGLHELAWSGFLAGLDSADTTYYAGASEDDSVTVAAYREDLALIADDSTLVEFDRTAGVARAAFLRRFWDDRGRQALRSAGERLKEHYRRVGYAERHYGLEVNRRFYAVDGTDMYRSGSTRFDDRGVVYVRYGEPDGRVATVTWGIQPNESWRYRRADGDLLLHFAANAGGDIHDYRLVPTVGSIGGVEPGDAARPATYFAYSDRCAIYPPFCKVQMWGPYGQRRALADEYRLVRNSVAWAVTTDGYELRFPRGLEASAMAFAVGQAGDRQLVHLAYQVALVRPETLPPGAAFKTPLRVRVNLFDSAGRSGGWLDTTTAILLSGGYATDRAVDAVGRVTLPLPAGRWRYQVALAYDDSTGQVLPTDSVEVGRFDGTRLAVSDLVLSKGGYGARWVPAQGDTAFFNPRRLWARSDTIALYHEIYGLEEGAPYTATLAVRRGKRVGLKLEWEGRASEQVTRVSRTLSFAALKPGDYVVELKVEDGSGRQAGSWQRISVR